MAEVWTINKKKKHTTHIRSCNICADCERDTDYDVGTFRVILLSRNSYVVSDVTFTPYNKLQRGDKSGYNNNGPETCTSLVGVNNTLTDISPHLRAGIEWTRAREYNDW